MINEKELIQQLPVVEGGASPLTAELPRVESEYKIQPATQAPTNGIQPLESHKVGSQIQSALNDEKVGKDFPELGNDLTSSLVWKNYINSKRRGAELPS